MFDGDPNTFYHSAVSYYGSPSGPGVHIYFGGTFAVSEVVFIARHNHYLSNNENTKFTIIKENGEYDDCGTLTGTNTISKTVADQTYKILCENRQGVGLKIWRTPVRAWCPAEISVSYLNTM